MGYPWRRDRHRPPGRPSSRASLSLRDTSLGAGLGAWLGVTCGLPASALPPRGRGRYEPLLCCRLREEPAHAVRAHRRPARGSTVLTSWHAARAARPRLQLAVPARDRGSECAAAAATARAARVPRPLVRPLPGPVGALRRRPSVVRPCLRRSPPGRWRTLDRSAILARWPGGRSAPRSTSIGRRALSYATPSRSSMPLDEDRSLPRLVSS